MNVVLIPFFLAANVVINNTSEWRFGPEYTYDLNMTYDVKREDDAPTNIARVNSTLKCRPNESNSLFCRLLNFTVVELIADRYKTKQVRWEQRFEIRFNEIGVEGLLVESPIRMEIVNILRSLANQFSMGADLRNRIDVSQFMVRETTPMGNCATMLKITREEPESDSIEEENASSAFRFMVLPMANVEPGTTLSIVKARTGCLSSPRYLNVFFGIIKMGRYITKIRIDDKFETITQLDGKLWTSVHDGTEFPPNIRIFFKEVIQLNLNSIEPAQEEIPVISYSNLIGLNINTDMNNDFID